MDMEAQIVDALRTELQRQAAEADGALRLSEGTPGRVRIDGPVDLEALAMAVAGSVAGGP
ncbi:hypothetical protein [Brevundimonas viscosa]|uniref:Uncharacterized protein n=1 Tax=Brevundimonas viscosa TaxID=871741 RepID=A0A1I6S9L4_9CAUL|nr:hypothetical protein [Brevundimonas viscosa]SFS73627.1 hypothetical protein SAMN05192570_2305 [Brevundimonas viscosa]